MRPLWALLEDGTFLNHGSFGATPFEVLREQERLRREMEEQPDRFFTGRIVPKEETTALREAARAVGEFVGVFGSNIALVENATVGTQAVLQSVALAPGDQILITDHQYNAVRLAVEARCSQTGATPLVVHIPLRTTSGEIRSRIREAANPKVKLAIVDHISSPSAYIFPIREIIEDLQALGILVHVDGAHALGQIPLDIGELRPDWYVSNAHKWLYAPKGTAFFYAAPSVAGTTRPIVTSHFIEYGFPRSFDYVGTRDCTGWLAFPAAIAFFRRLGAEKLWRHNRELLERGTALLAALGAQPIGDIGMCGAMRSFVLPQQREARDDDGAILKDALWNDERIQTMAITFMGALVLRVSAQAYVDDSDLVKLRDALDRSGWPGR